MSPGGRTAGLWQWLLRFGRRNRLPLSEGNAVHPLVRLNPVTSRKSLYLGRRRNACVQGLELADSEALLDTLWAHATQASLTWVQQWQQGDLVAWDNRVTLHRRDAFDPLSRRYMHRTQVSEGL